VLVIVARGGKWEAGADLTDLLFLHTIKQETPLRAFFPEIIMPKIRS